MRTITIRCDSCGKQQQFTADKHGGFSYDDLLIHKVDILKGEKERLVVDLCNRCYQKIVEETGGRE